MGHASASFEPDTPNSQLTNTADIYGALRALVLMEKDVEIMIDGSSTQFRTRFSDVDLKSRSFFMSALIPAEGNQLLHQGKRFRVFCESRGVQIRFEADGRLRYMKDADRYRGEFPSSLEYVQRRGAYRVNIPTAHKVLVEIPEVDHSDPELVVPKHRGRLLDLSESGFKALFSGDLKDELQALNPIAAATIRFNEQHHMDCGLEVRHLIIDNDGNTRAGFVFSRVSSNAQRYIRKLIADFQWEERHQANAEPEAGTGSAG